MHSFPFMDALKPHLGGASAGSGVWGGLGPGRVPGIGLVLGVGLGIYIYCALPSMRAPPHSIHPGSPWLGWLEVAAYQNLLLHEYR